MATSLAVPVAYITVLVTALAIFSRVYRRRKLAEKTAFEPWFPTHPSRDLYISMLSASGDSESPLVDSTSTSTPPDNLIKSALLLRAIDDVKRIWRIRDDKMALTSLHQRGLLGDDTKARFEFAEKELEAEILDVVQEANSFKQGWGGLIFATATEMAQAEKTRETVLNIPRIRQREEKRLAIRRKYLPDSTPAPASTALPAGAATPQKIGPASGTASPAAPASGTTTPNPAAATTETPVKLAAPGTAAETSSAASTPSKNTPSKKKKGKK